MFLCWISHRHELDEAIIVDQREPRLVSEKHSRERRHQCTPTLWIACHHICFSVLFIPFKYHWWVLFTLPMGLCGGRIGSPVQLLFRFIIFRNFQVLLSENTLKWMQLELIKINVVRSFFLGHSKSTSSILIYVFWVILYSSLGAYPTFNTLMFGILTAVKKMIREMMPTSEVFRFIILDWK